MTLLDLLVLLGAAVAIVGVNVYFFGEADGEGARGGDTPRRGEKPTP